MGTAFWILQTWEASLSKLIGWAGAQLTDQKQIEQYHEADFPYVSFGINYGRLPEDYDGAVLLLLRTTAFPVLIIWITKWENSNNSLACSDL